MDPLPKQISYFGGYNLHPRLTLLIVVIESVLEYIITLNQLTMDHEWSNKKTHEYLVFK